MTIFVLIRIINGKFGKNYTSAVIEKMNWALKEFIYKEKVKLEKVNTNFLYSILERLTDAIKIKNTKVSALM